AGRGERVWGGGGGGEAAGRSGGTTTHLTLPSLPRRVPPFPPASGRRGARARDKMVASRTCVHILARKRGPRRSGRNLWVPAFAGMTIIACGYHVSESDH